MRLASETPPNALSQADEFRSSNVEPCIPLTTGYANYGPSFRD